MRKRSKYTILFEHIPLPGELPVMTGNLFTQKDREITYLHRHDVPELGLCLSGGGIFVIGGRVFPFSDGCASYIPPGVPHLAQSMPGTVSKWRWTYVDFTSMILPHFPEEDSVFAGNPEGGILPSGSETASILAKLQRGEMRAGVAVALAVLLAAALARELPPSMEAPGEESFVTGYDRIGRALEYLAAHYQRKIDFSRLPGMCGMSPANFRKVFFKVIGCPPSEYAARLRISRARALLNEAHLSVNDISAIFGYGDLSCFNRKFRDMTGMSPTAFRNRRKETGRG